MELTVNTDPKSGALRLSGDLNIYQLESLKNALARPIASGTDLLLDLSEIATCDFTGLQLLYSVARATAYLGHTMRIENPSDSFTRSVSHMGFPNSFQP